MIQNTTNLDSTGNYACADCGTTTHACNTRHRLAATAHNARAHRITRNHQTLTDIDHALAHPMTTFLPEAPSVWFPKRSNKSQCTKDSLNQHSLMEVRFYNRSGASAVLTSIRS